MDIKISENMIGKKQMEYIIITAFIGHRQENVDFYEGDLIPVEVKRLD